MDISVGETGQPPTQETALCEADVFWDDVKPVADEAIEVFKKDCLHEVGEGVKKQGTVVKWLDVTLGCDKEKNLDFGMWLFHQFPPQDDLFYHWGSELPWVENELALGIAAPTVFGILAFAWAKGCSLKPSPGPKTFDALGDQIMCDGFVTSGEPLLICQPRTFMGPVPDHYAELQVRMHETWTASGRLMCSQPWVHQRPCPHTDSVQHSCMELEEWCGPQGCASEALEVLLCYLCAPTDGGQQS